MIEEFEILGKTLEYLDDEHLYIYDGVILPSVTQFLGTLYNDYKWVNAETLKRASEKGTAMHKAIELYETQGKESDLKEVRNYKFLKKKYAFEVLESELPVVIFHNEKPILAGRLDQIIKKDGKLYVNDLKRVSAPNKEKIALQLNLYRLGYQQCYNQKIEGLSMTHLREEKRKFTELPINEEYINGLIEQRLERGTHDKA